MTDKRKYVLVAGATGYLGKYMVRALCDAGYRVRALARKAESLGPLADLCEDVFVGEATKPETLNGLCDGIDIVISSLGIRAWSGNITYWDVDYQANMNVLELAEKAGVGYFMFVSVLHGAEVRARVPQIEARERVVDELKKSDMDWTIIRPTGFFNDMSEFFNMAQKGTVWIIGNGKLKLNPIHGADLADAILEAMEKNESRGAQLDLGGPETMTMIELAETAFRVLGKKPKIRSCPAWVLKAVGTITSPFSTNFSNMMKFFASFADVDGVGAACGDNRLEDFYQELSVTENSDNMRIGK